MQIIPGSSNLSLASKLSQETGYELLPADIGKFKDGELKVQVHGNIGKEVVIVQSTGNSVNDNLIELLLIADTAKRAGATTIAAIIPYFGYSRQDKCTYKNGPIPASLLAKIIQSAGITEIITLDLHSIHIEGYFDIPVANLTTETIFFPIINANKNTIIVSPDIGAIARAKNYSSMISLDLVIINKTRDQNGRPYCSTEIIGDANGKDCIIIDDIVDGGDTLCLAAEILLSNKAKSIRAIATHGILSGNAVSKIADSAIEKLYISDSVPLKTQSSKIELLPINELIAKFLKTRLHSQLI